MAYRDLFIDMDRGELVTSASDSTTANMPPFVQGDSLRLRIWLLRGFSRLSSYTQVPVEGLTLQVAIGLKTGDETVYYTQQFTWTASEDLGQPYFSAVLPMNTSDIDELLGPASSATAHFEVKVVDEATPRTVLSRQITVQAAVIKENGLTVPAGLTGLSAEAAVVTFLQRRIVGSIDLINEDTGYGVRLSSGPAGEFLTEVIVPTP